MFLFLRLILAHLIADFPLQFSKLFKLKVESLKGVILHGCVFGIVAIGFTYPYITFSFIGTYLLFLFVFHIFIDWLKIKMINTWKMKDNLWLFLLDQAFHFISVAVVIPFRVVPERHAFFLARLYNNDKFIIFCIFYTITSFMATILIYYMKKTFLRRDIAFPAKGKNFDMLERVLITTFVFLSGWFWVAAAAVTGVKFLVARKNKFSDGEYDFSKFGIAANFLVAAAMGLILKAVLR